MARNRNTNPARIDLRFGGGHVDCLLDLTSGRIERYAGDPRDFPRYGEEPPTDGIHSRLGGKQFYLSRSGLSGAGWVPARPSLKKLGTYRVDVGGVLLGFSPEREFSPDVGEFEIYVPFSYRGDNMRLEHPIVVRERSGKVTLLPEQQLTQFLRGEIETEEREFTFTYLKKPNATEEKLVAKVHQPKCRYGYSVDSRATRVLVEGFHASTLAFEYPDSWLPEGDGEFWKRLGFRRMPDGLYKVVRNICRFMVDEWTDIAEIQKWIPANVHILAPHLYIQERNGQHIGVGRFAYEGQWFDFEVYLDPSTAFRIFAGNREETTKLEKDLEQGAHNKYVRVLEDAQRHEEAAREQLERDTEFRELLEKNASVELSVDDSIAAGNCRPGTDDFVSRFFPGRTTVTVGQLARFAAHWGVRRVLEHKFAEEIRQNDHRALQIELLDSPQGEADDLKRINGISPKVEQLLNELGVYHFFQLASLDDAQATALDEWLQVRGRVVRDRWVEQARRLRAEQVE